MLELFIVILYVAALGFIFLFCLTQLYLAINYIRHKKQVQKLREQIRIGEGLKEFPVVTVQLPIFNELYVVERLIDAVVNFDYPKDRLEIQVLDDSTDETLEISRKKVKEYQEKGIDIKLIRRENRVGFKAGALKEGMKTAKGEFFAIFDADFIPTSDFLLETIPYLKESKIGLVQTKWLHINRSYSLLTRVQAFALDAHFNIEQNGRHAAGVFINFNGTAGVWRKECIEDAGGWSSDTLTEDLDLSFRAQLKGWKFIFLDNVGAPAELPAAMSAIKSQQFRWSKGPAEVSKKLLGKMLWTKLPMKVKWLGFFHMLNSSINIFILLTAVLSVPLIMVKEQFNNHWAFSVMYVFYFGLLAIGVAYLISQILEEKGLKKGVGSFFLLFPTFLSLSMGLSLHNGLAALRGFFGRKSDFVRTPKHNITNGKDHWEGKKYNRLKIDFTAFIEILMAAYFLFGMYMAFVLQEFEMLLFHFLLFAGFFSISFFSFKHAIAAVWANRRI